MNAQPTLVMTFASLDDAESALDWIGVDFVESDQGFLGHLEVEDRELLDDAIAAADSPAPVRDLARAMVVVLDASGTDAAPTWRVAYDG